MFGCGRAEAPDQGVLVKSAQQQSCFYNPKGSQPFVFLDKNMKGFHFVWLLCSLCVPLCVIVPSLTALFCHVFCSALFQNQQFRLVLRSFLVAFVFVEICFLATPTTHVVRLLILVLGPVCPFLALVWVIHGNVREMNIYQDQPGRWLVRLGYVLLFEIYFHFIYKLSFVASIYSLDTFRLALATCKYFGYVFSHPWIVLAAVCQEMFSV